MSDFSSEADRHFLDTSSTTDGVGIGGDSDDGRGHAEGDVTDGWTPDRSRMLGALIEKALATPQNYPLSLNALTVACNQTTNRDPIMDLTDGDIERLLSEAKNDGWVRFVHPRSGRGVTKYRHVVDEVLELDDAKTALVGVLLLRGPQTASELRSRTERLAPMDPETVEQTLTALSQHRPQPLARRLPREPGHREQRWIQLLCREQGEDRAGQAPTPSPRRAAATAAPAAIAATAANQDEVAELRRELAAVKAELTELRSAFERFRAEFG